MASTWLSSISSIASYSNLPMKPMERSAMAMISASTPGPRMVTRTKPQISDVDRARRHDDQERERPDQGDARRGVARGQKRDRRGQNDRQQRPHGRHVDGVPQRPPQPLGIGPARRQHASEYVGRLLGRGRDKVPDRVRGHDPPAEHRERDQREPAREAQQLGRPRHLPPGAMSIGEHEDGHHWILPRMKLDAYSQAMTMTMMRMRIAAASSNS